MFVLNSIAWLVGGPGMEKVLPAVDWDYLSLWTEGLTEISENSGVFPI